MLQGFRAGSRNLFTKIFLALLMGLLILSFAFWGIGDVFRGFGTRTVAKVGSTEISVDLFRRSFTERLQEIGRRVGRGINAEEARKRGLDRQILGELLTEATLDEQARRLGLAITDEMLAERVRNNPVFKGPDGNFSMMAYQRVLRDNNYSEATYLAAERRLALRQQILFAVGGDVTAPQVLREAFWRYGNEVRAIELVRLTPEQAGAIAAPTEEQLKTYFEANKAAFRAPEYRQIRLIHLSPQQVQASITISDDDLKKYYEAQKARITIPEKRQIEQVTFESLDAAKAAAERIAKGEAFDAVAKDLKRDVVSLGLVAKTEVLDTTVADAAFSLAPSTVSAPVQGRFGPVLVRVVKVEAGRVPPLEEIAQTLRGELAANQAYERTQELHDKIEDERGAGSTLAEISEKLKVPAITIEAIDRSGRRPDGQPVVDIPALDTFLPTAFTVQKNVETEAIELRETRSTVWYEVVDIMPARDRTFEEARADIEKRWKEDQLTQKLDAMAKEIQQKLDAGEAFAAAAPNLKVEKLEGIKRNAQVPGIDANTITRIFLTAQGKSGVGTPPDSPNRLLFRVVSATVPAGEPAAELVQFLQQSIAQDWQTQYVVLLQDTLGLRINEAAVRQVTGDTAPN